jgi:uncharacterized phage protein (TIGR01671 family)
MREIKFRAWDGEKMIYPDKDGWYNKCKLEGVVHPQNIQLGTAIRRLTVMQFTGLLDESGKEIYEGDILSGGISKDCVVEFKNGTFTVWDDQPIGWDVEDFDELPEVLPTDKWANVIGNVFSNPELLK